VWLTLSSVIGWASFFDFGLGNGLRNRFSEALARDDKALARTYVSTTYGILGMTFIVLITVFYLVNRYIDWQRILNTFVIPQTELSEIALIVFVFFILRFFFNLIGVILLADQRSSISGSFNTIGSVLSLIII